MVFERCFRSLKPTHVRITPMYRWASRRIEAHVKICALSLLIERIAELQCGQPWHRILKALERLQVTFFDSTLINWNAGSTDTNSRDCLSVSI